MNDTATKTYHVAVIERALAYYEVEAESPRDAAENWSDGEFYDRDDEALETEGPAIVHEREPDGTWRKVPRSEWENETPPVRTAPGRDAVAPTPSDLSMNIGRSGAGIYDDHATIAEAERWPAEDPSGGRFVIHSAEEDTYWSNEVGWTGPEEATVFAAAERERLHLPVGGRWVASRPYSVLLLYPEYANDGGTETYYTFVEAPDPAAAVALARQQALAAQEGVIFPAADFAPLLVTEGHHYGQPMSND
jgi:hypothetical protein